MQNFDDVLFRMANMKMEGILDSKAHALSQYLQSAQGFLSKRDMIKAERHYGRILEDLARDCANAHFDMKDSMTFCFHMCYAYSRAAVQPQCDETKELLLALQHSSDIPLIPYVKAFSHMACDQLDEAEDAIELCQSILDDGYGFVQQSQLNESLIPEMNDEFMRLKLDGLRTICGYLKSDKNNADQKKAFKCEWLRLGMLSEIDFSGNRNNEQDKKTNAKSDKETTAFVQENVISTGAVKKIKNKKNNEPNNDKITNPGGNKAGVKGNNTAVSRGTQTSTEKEPHRVMLAEIHDSKNKFNNLSKSVAELKQLQNRHNDLLEELIKNGKIDDKKNNNNNHTQTEWDVLKKAYFDLGKAHENQQIYITHLEKILSEQIMHKCLIQNQHFDAQEEYCNKQVTYLGEMQMLIPPGTTHIGKPILEELQLWKNTLQILYDKRREFKVYYKHVKDLVDRSCFTQISTKDWPAVKKLRIELDSIVHKRFRDSLTAYGQNLRAQISNGLRMDPRPTIMVPLVAPQHMPLNQEGNKLLPMPSVVNIPQANLPLPSNINRMDKNVSLPSTSVVQPQPILRNINPPIINNNRKMVNPNPPNGALINIQQNTPNNNKQSSTVYQSEQELIDYLKTNLHDQDEIKIIETMFKVRDHHGGTLNDIAREQLLSETRQLLKKPISRASSGWDIHKGIVWNNPVDDHSCSICLEEFSADNCKKLQCQHVFHPQCIDSWLRQHNTCPNCREHTVIDEEYPPLKKVANS